jgi:hypothetical protein
MEPGMDLIDSRIKLGAIRTVLLVKIALAAALLISSAAASCSAPASSRTATTQERVETLALKWFAQMQTGQIDRTQLSTQYGAQLTDAAVHGMSQNLKEYRYGASPTRAELLRTSSMGDQTFYLVKLVFPRGDAASLLFGFNGDGKITGVSPLNGG